MDMTGQTVVVTGAASATGESMVRRLKALGGIVIAIDSKRPRASADIYLQVDMSDLDSINEAVDVLPCGIDMLCNVKDKNSRAACSDELSDYALGVKTLAEESLALINSGGWIVNIAPLPEWGTTLNGSWHERGIRVRRVERNEATAHIEQYLSSQITPCY